MYDEDRCPKSAGIARPNTQVDDQFSDLSKSIQNLDDLLGRMTEKLIPVLRNELVAGANTTPCAPECGLVPLAEEIRHNRKKVDRAAEQVQSWLSRIEIA